MTARKASSGKYAPVIGISLAARVSLPGINCKAARANAAAANVLAKIFMYLLLPSVNSYLK